MKFIFTQSRKGAKKTKLCVFAPLRLCVKNYLFANKTAATTPAVSARNLVSPKLTGR